MDTFWDRARDLRESINGQVQHREEVTIKTRFVKIALGLYLFQSLLIAVVLAIKNNSSVAWLIPIAAFLQISWAWNKVTDTWRGGEDYQHFENVEEPAQSLHPPEIRVDTANPLIPEIRVDTADPLIPGGDVSNV